MTFLVAVPKPERAAKTRRKLRPVNGPRRRRALVEDFGGLAVFVRRLPCLVVGCLRWPVDAAHVRSRGAGHHAWIEIDGDRFGNIVPLCRQHHDQQGRLGIKDFEGSYGSSAGNGGLGVWLARLHRVETLADAGRIIGVAAEGGSP